LIGSPKLSASNYLLTIGEMAIDIAVSLLLLLMVGRAYGPEGLGVYTFLLSVFVIVSFLCEFGVNKWVEKELAAGLHRGKQDVTGFLAEAKAAAFAAAIFGAVLITVLGNWAANAETVAQGKWTGFLLLTVAVPLNIYSGYLTSVLHGRGHHIEVSKAGFSKRVAQVILVFILSSIRLRPELLVSVFIFSELIFILNARKKAAVPSLAAALGKLGHSIAVFRQSIQYYFTQEGLRVLFFVDFFALGFFVTAAREGAYAEASVLARLFLLIPLGAAPLYRAKLYRASETDIHTSPRRTAARLFTVHGIGALIFLLYFPQILRAFFHIQGDVPVFFKAFSMLLPGLLFFIPTAVMEPIFLRSGREDELNKMAARVFLLNAFLNFYLIPFAGVFGAAAATTISLVVYFVLFSRNVGGEKVLPVQVYLLAGALIYCGYHILKAVKLPAVVIIPGIAVLLPMLFWMVGMYGQGEGRRQEGGGQDSAEDVESETAGEGNVIPFPREGE
jgi:O-antigen/teichoic acid export membrane protein